MAIAERAGGVMRDWIHAHWLDALMIAAVAAAWAMVWAAVFYVEVMLLQTAGLLR